jgi:hypothetical protein
VPGLDGRLPAGAEGSPPGKLKAVARRWASGRGGPAKPADDPLTQAAPIPQRSTPSAEEEIELPEELQKPVCLFFALGTQWRHAGMTGLRIGLDYTAIEATARMLDIEMTPQLLVDLRVMEDEALATWAEKQR